MAEAAPAFAAVCGLTAALRRHDHWYLDTDTPEKCDRIGKRMTKARVIKKTRIARHVHVVVLVG